MRTRRRIKSQGAARSGTHLPESDLRSYQISFNWTECHLQNGGALAGRLAGGRSQRARLRPPPPLPPLAPLRMKPWRERRCLQRACLSWSCSSPPSSSDLGKRTGGRAVSRRFGREGDDSSGAHLCLWKRALDPCPSPCPCSAPCPSPCLCSCCGGGGISAPNFWSASCRGCASAAFGPSARGFASSPSLDPCLCLSPCPCPGSWEEDMK